MKLDSFRGNWLHAVEPTFHELESYARAASASCCETVLRDPHINALEPFLHQVRAAYEYETELAMALSILARADGADRLVRLLRQESFWALGPDLIRSLNGCRRVAVAGSGPLPLTALSIARELSLEVTCIERDQLAFDIGRQMVRLAGCGDRICCIRSDVMEIDDLDRFDAMVVAVLVGVDMGESRRHCRTLVAEHLIAGLRPGARLVVRDPHGLGRLFHPPLELALSNSFTVERTPPGGGPDEPYRSTIVVLHRIGAASP